MKIFELLELSFLLFAFTTLSLPGAGADDTANDPVIDVFGNNLTTHYHYYILASYPVDTDTGSEILVANESTGIPPCLILSAISHTQGLAISPVFPSNDSLIRINTMLNFQFNFSCDDWSTKWKISNYTSLKQWFVTIGGNHTYDWFQIGKYNDKTHPLLCCPEGQSFCDCQCVEVGTVREDGVAYLAPNGNPFPIVFGQAENAENVAPE